MHNYLKRVFIQSLLFVVGFTTLSAQTSSLSVDESRKFDYYFHEAMNAKVLDKYDEAFDFLRYCMEIDSTNANVVFELGNFYNSIDNKNKAIDCFRKATEYDKDNFFYNMSYANICLELKQFTNAVEIYERLLKQDPENSELYIYLSEAYRSDGDLLKAIGVLDKLEAMVGLDEKISLQKYQLYRMMNQESKAFAEIQKYIDKYPGEIKYYLLLGNLYMQTSKLNEAYMVYSKAKAIDPDDPYLITSMAEYYEQTNNKKAAEEELQIALLSPKLDIDTKLGILAQYVGTLQKNRKETEAANALFDTLMVQHPQEPKLNLMYGNLLMMQNRKKDAQFQFQIFAEANPTNPIGWEQMMFTVFPDSLEKTIEICNTAISYIPDQPQFYFYLGASLYLKEEHKQALDVLNKGVSFVDERNVGLLSEFYAQIGDLYYHTQRQDSAFIAYEKSLKYNPSNLGVLNNYSYFLSLEKKDLDKAERMSSLTVKAEPNNPTYLDTYGWVLFEQGAYIMAKIYIENAVKYTEEKNEKVNTEVLEHYGDVLYKTDEKEKALEYWIKAKEAGGSKSKTLEKKIKTKTYISE